MKAPGFYFPTTHTLYCPGERVSVSPSQFLPVPSCQLAQPHAQHAGSALCGLASRPVESRFLIPTLATPFDVEGVPSGPFQLSARTSRLRSRFNLAPFLGGSKDSYSQRGSRPKSWYRRGPTELNPLKKMSLVLVNSDLAARKSIQHLPPYKSVFRPFPWSLYLHKYPSLCVFSSSLTLFGSLSGAISVQNSPFDARNLTRKFALFCLLAFCSSTLVLLVQSMVQNKICPEANSLKW
eukprot:2980404-Rhodomonas_salina.1